jgi:hypothetical protein
MAGGTAGASNRRRCTKAPDLNAEYEQFTLKNQCFFSVPAEFFSWLRLAVPARYPCG